MGVPGLYRWLVDKYPETLCSVAEDLSPYSKGPRIDTTKPNPNGVEFDNLYIDMNGVIHPCFHPEGLPAPQSYDDVFKSIFRYIERVYSIVRPRKLLFLSVDGVAPRAKMNHQRIRRFRSAREAASKVSAVDKYGIGKSEGDKKLDSNVITPGTEFMALLSSALKYYVHRRMNVDPAWQCIKVIISDSTVAGEGEGKIVAYIRSQRNLPGYDPNTRHCLHGLDADLIMLALATHEIHISILREIITNGQIVLTKHMKEILNGNQKQYYPGCMRHYLHDLNFEFFNIWVLREYLERELLPNVQGTDFERLIDDFVFMCLFVGNDFLPRLPSLDISEGGIELLMTVYQEEYVKMGYLTNSFEVNLKSMEHFLQALSSHENAIFMKRSQFLMGKNRMKMKRTWRGSRYSVYDDYQPNIVERQTTTSKVEIHKRYTKRGYYTENFDCESHDIDRIRRDVVLKYTEGICWIMHYYYQGVSSWQWFYPYHYAPFASDFCGLDKLEICFTLGQPFKPLDQLLGVLPAASAQALPLFYRDLMTKPSSPILDFYPKDAKIDKNGKKHAWQGVCKLPFILESRLLSETVKLEHTLTDEEKQRNTLGRDRLFVHSWHPLAKTIKNQPLSAPNSELEIQIKPELSGGMNGYMYISDKPVCPRNIPSPVDGKQIVKRNEVRSVDYMCPSRAHISSLPRGVKMPPKILRRQDNPRPPILLYATPGQPQSSGLSQSIISESLSSPTKKSQKKRKRDEVSGNDPNNEARDGKQNSGDGIINGKLVVGNDETQREDKQVKGDSMLDNRTSIHKSGTDEKLMDEMSVEICEKSTKRSVSGLPSPTDHGSLGRENEADTGGEPKRKQRKKRVHSVEGEEGQKSIKVEVCEKPKNTVLLFSKEHEVKGEAQGDGKMHCVNVEGGENIDKRQEIKGGENEDNVSGEHKRKKEKKRKQVRGDMVEVNGAGQSSSNVEASEKSLKSENEGTEPEPEPEPERRRKKHKSKQVKDEMVGASESNNDVEIPTNRLESDLVQETSADESKQKKQTKRRSIKGGAEPHLFS